MEPGRIGIVARSPSLAREVEQQLPVYGLGASKVVDLSATGQEGVTHLELLQMFNRHWGTDAVVLLGAIDADEEDACVDWMAHHMDKPVIGCSEGLPRSQAERLRASGVHMGRTPASLAELAASLVELPWLPFD
jgi:succinyl-CoA synthetase alpha subunit